MCRSTNLRHGPPPIPPSGRAARKKRGFGWFSLLGCGALIAVIGCFGFGRNAHWAEHDVIRTLPTIGTSRVAIKTDNGRVQVRPAEPGVREIEVRAIIRASGPTPADAQDAIDAIEIATPVAGADDATQEISYAWRVPREPQWQAEVSFEVVMPHDLTLVVETQNGQIDVVGITADCQLTTRNGAVRAVAGADRLAVRSSNGEITIESPARFVEVDTNNGRIDANLSNPEGAAGHVKAANGSVRVELPTTASVEVKCRTRNGRIRNSIAFDQLEKEGRTRLSGKLGSGEATLDVETKNGDISLSSPSQRRRGRDDS